MSNKIMEDYDLFFRDVKSAAESIKGIDKKEVIRVVTHLDSDGICASSIMTKALIREKNKSSLSIVQQLSEDFLKELSHENYRHYIFLDLGSGYLDIIGSCLKEKHKVIIDHHTPQELKCDNTVHLNPHFYGIDGGNEIAGAGVSYLVAKEMSPLNKDSSHLAVIGAIGDSQENIGFGKLNQMILADAVNEGMIQTKKDLRLFGSQTRPIHKALELSTDLFVPGVTSSESGAIQFLHEIGINPKADGRWRTLSMLTDEEQQRLTTAIILRRINEKEPEDVFGTKYILPHEPKDSLFYDAKEFSTMINACGRLDKPSIGIGICLGSKSAKKRAMELLMLYKQEIMNALEWIKNHKEEITREKGFVIINAKSSIRPSLIGTLTSILSKSDEYSDDFIIMMGRDEKGYSKVSFRSSKQDVNLREIIKEMAEKIGGSYGGHTRAAGAIIPQEKEEQFIIQAADVLTKKMMEEKVH